MDAVYFVVNNIQRDVDKPLDAVVNTISLLESGGTIPFIARLIESAIREVDKGLIEAARAMGATPLQIVTKVLLADKEGNAVAWSSSGALGFSGAKKGTPFAAAKVGELVGDKAAIIGVKEVDVVIRGVGAGRESALRPRHVDPPRAVDRHRRVRVGAEGQQPVDELAHVPGRTANGAQVLMGGVVEPTFQVLFEQAHKAGDVAQRRTQVVRDRVGKGLQIRSCKRCSHGRLFFRSCSSLLWKLQEGCRLIPLDGGNRRRQAMLIGSLRRSGI